MLRTASSLPPKGLLTLGSGPACFQTTPPACYRASWQLPGPDSHRQATTSLRTTRSTTTTTSRCHLLFCWAHEKGSLTFLWLRLIMRHVGMNFIQLAASRSLTSFLDDCRACSSVRVGSERASRRNCWSDCACRRCRRVGRPFATLIQVVQQPLWLVGNTRTRLSRADYVCPHSLVSVVGAERRSPNFVRSFVCKLPAPCRLLSFTWEHGFPPSDSIGRSRMSLWSTMVVSIHAHGSGGGWCTETLAA